MAHPPIAFVAVDGIRVAYAAHGAGPPLVLPAPWIGHLEQEWDFPELRAFVLALAEDRTVVRYDRPGTGVSDRSLPPGGPSLDHDVQVLAAVLDAVGAERADLLGISWGSAAALALAARRPDRVGRVATFGGTADGASIAPPKLREAVVSTVRAHWGAGARLLADVWVPGADTELRTRFAQLQRVSSDPETAARMLELVYAGDVRAELHRVSAPVLVMHRRDDRTVPYACARELAASIPGAQLLALEGDRHPPWLGDADAVVAALRGFLGGTAVVAPPPGEDPLSARELEVLRLAAAGLSDAAIAERLVVSPHTIHRHMANIRTKLRQPSRAAAAAHAARRGLI